MNTFFLSVFCVVFFLACLIQDSCLHAQTTLDNLRKLTDQEWLGMTTEQRLDALNVSNNRAQNKTFFGDFNQFQDMYNGWGYDYYEMNDEYQNYTFRGFQNYNIATLFMKIREG